MFSLFVGSIINNLLLIKVLNLNIRGEANSDGKTPAADGKSADDKTISFTPEQQKEVDRIIQNRLLREREKYSDHETLKTKLQQYENQLTERQQKDLEESKKYDEAKKTYLTQIEEAKRIINEKDRMLTQTNISYALTNEINKQNAFGEETLALIKDKAILKDGQVRIKTKDSSGLDVEYSVEEGVKKFLESKPHLIKSNFKSGGGTSGGTTQPVTDGSNGDLHSLNAELVKAMNRGDFKRVSEIKTKIRMGLTSKGVSV